MIRLSVPEIEGGGPLSVTEEEKKKKKDRGIWGNSRRLDILAPIIFAFERQDENGPVNILQMATFTSSSNSSKNNHFVAIREIFKGVFFIDLGFFVDFMFVWHFDGRGYRYMVTYQG